MNRRTFLKCTAAAAASPYAAPYARLAAAVRNKIKITDVKCMIVRGTWDWNLVKIETDAGLYGIGEAYWGPGVKDLILSQMKPLVIGEDPLNVDKLYTKMLMRSAGAGAIAGRPARREFGTVELGDLGAHFAVAPRGRAIAQADRSPFQIV
jgi:hypothetical protein